MAEKLGLQVEVGANIKPLSKGLADARKELTTTAVAAGKLDSSLGKLGPGTNQATAALTNLGRVAQDAPFGFIGIQNNLNPLLESFQRLKVETGSTSGALKALGSSLIGAGGLGLALSIVSSAFLIFQNGIAGFNQKTKEAKETTESFADALKSVSASIAKEATDVFSLIAVLKSETETRERKLAAIKELQKIQPEIFNSLKLEKGAVEGLSLAYQAYLANLKTVINAKLTQQQIEKNLSRQFELNNLLESVAKYDALVKPIKDATESSLALAKAQREVYNARLKNKIFGSDVSPDQASKELQILERNFDALAEKLFKLTKGVEIHEIKVKPQKVKPQKVEVDIPERLLENPFPPGKVKVPEIKFPEMKMSFKDTNIIIDGSIVDKTINGIQKLIREANLEALTQEFSILVSDAMKGVAVDVGETIGNVFADLATNKGNGLDNLFAGLFSSVGAQIQALGKFLIRSAIQVKIAKEAFKKLLDKPVLAIAVGIGLIALGAALKSAAKQQFKGFALGGRNIAGGVALVGERGPELVNLPKGSDVIPNSNFNNIQAGAMEVYGKIIAQGTELAVIIDRARATNRRNN